MFKFVGVYIRPIEEDDLPKLASLRADPRVWVNLGDITMVTLKQQLVWYKRVHTNPKIRYFILYSDKIDFIGVVRMDEIDLINRSARIGGDILPKYQGKGYGTKMYKLLLKYCFDFLNLHRVWLLVLESNTVALNLYKKAGFVEEGRQRMAIFRDGKFIDYIMMSLLQSEYTVKNPI